MSASSSEVHDPVCGMLVSVEGPHQLEHAGRAFHFCCARCLERFQADPDRFLLEGVPAPVSTGGQFTCPMHPEIVQEGPGPCPICGMALEPTDPSEADESPELADMSRRFWASLIFTLPVFMIAMTEMFESNPLTAHFRPQVLVWTQFALGTPVVLWGGWPFFARGWASVRTAHLNMFTLIAIGTGAAWVYSAVAAIAPQTFPDSFRGAEGQVAVYFEAAAVIVTLVLLGQVLELRARSQTGAAIRALLGLAPKTARRVAEDGSEEDVPLDTVRVGDLLRVRPGEKNMR